MTTSLYHQELSSSDNLIKYNFILYVSDFVLLNQYQGERRDRVKEKYVKVTLINGSFSNTFLLDRNGK